jgi:hypothetical protein
LVYLRTGLIHEALGVIYEVRSSTIGRAIGEVRPLLAERPGRAACVSDERKQNTIKTTTISHGEGRTLWCGAVRPGRMHDQTAMRTEGIAEQFRLHPQVKAEVDEGYRGQRVLRPGERSAPQAEEPRQRTITEQYGWRQAKRRQSSRRIAVEYANAELGQWRPLQRWTGRHQDYAETHCAIAGLVSDRAAKRAAATGPAPSSYPFTPRPAESFNPHHARLPRP